MLKQEFMSREEVLKIINSLPAHIKLKKEIEPGVLSHQKLYICTNIMVGKDDRALYAKLLGFKKGYKLTCFETVPISVN
jgi:hypothetical protein